MRGVPSSMKLDGGVLSVLDPDALLAICSFLPDPRDAALFCHYVPAAVPLFWSRLLSMYGYMPSMRLFRPTTSVGIFMYEVIHAQDAIQFKLDGCWHMECDSITWYACDLNARDCVTIHVKMGITIDSHDNYFDHVQEINIGQNPRLTYKDTELLMASLCLASWPQLRQLCCAHSKLNCGFFSRLSKGIDTGTFSHLHEIYAKNCSFESESVLQQFHSSALYGTFHNLQVLDLHDSHMSQSMVQWVIDAFPFMPSLQKVSLRGNCSNLSAVHDLLALHTSTILQSLTALELDDLRVIRQLYTLMKATNGMLPLLVYFGREASSELSHEEIKWLSAREYDACSGRQSIATNDSN